MICPNAPWYWPFHRFMTWFSAYGQTFRRCQCGEIRN